MDLERYRDNLDHEARRNKRGQPEPTRQLRKDSRLYCLVWAENDLFKVGLGSGKNARGASALRSITKYFSYDGITPGRPDEWRADLRVLDDRAWGDGQRFEMVFATALKQGLGAEAAGAVGLEWFCHRDLQMVQWEEALTAATNKALRFSGLHQPEVRWAKQSPGRVRQPPGSGLIKSGSSQRDAWRTTRNKRGDCAKKGCGALVSDQDVRQDGFLYCSEAHATVDRQSDTGPSPGRSARA